MTLIFDDIEFESEIPDMPESGMVVQCTAPRFEERAKGIDALTKRLDLGEMRDVETQFGRALISERGEAEYFAASGAVWSTNILHELKADDEFLDWDGLEESRDADGQPVLTLGSKVADQALELANELIDMAGFDMKHAQKPQLHLMQVAQADEKGRQLRSGAGEATVSMGYALEGLPILGAGGKTLIDMIPMRGPLQPTGAVNIWRTPGKQSKVQIGGTEAALVAGLLEDPDLNIASEKGAKITIQRLRFGLMSMPAAVHQSLLFPALEFEARVDLAKTEEHYFIGRVVPVATPKAYARAGMVSEHFGLGM
ncbi:hypothetical protein [Granulosicoccus antarcticus]|uniref:Uncharacterized protein n=1 Tax=Granulosicoccus antarcticus IMCC3135 TaxID=1192854 RepID=A0A2Z2PA11_9GAMM|nr:hypothetical protein [Granulosicoccus antarcticus]ASJ76724.1 hypothetical protein IMCC3135_33400 [Granulosicoccus antarcticus IMCC3135]